MRVDLLPTTFEGKLTRLIQESSEVIKAVTKLQQYGEKATDSVTGITYDNVIDLLGEIDDLEHAVAALKDYYKNRGTTITTTNVEQPYQDTV